MESLGLQRAPRSGRALAFLLALALGPAACGTRAATPAAAPTPTAAPAPTAASTAAGSPTTPASAVAASLAPLFTDPAVAHAHLGVLVRSLRTGDTLFAMNEGRMLVPASNMKVLTVAAAARKLGWDHRFHTRIVATGTLQPNGTLTGDLVVVGGGDPTLNPRHPDRWAVLDDWAAQIAARGVKVIGGHLVGDDNAYAEPGWGSGWSWDDLVLGYGAPVGALQYHENQLEVMIGPGMTVGARAILSLSPADSGMLVENAVTTVAAGAPSRVTLERLPGTTLLTARGELALDARPRTMTAAVDNPTRLFVNAFREALFRKGVFVAGSAVDIDELSVAPDVAGGTPWITDVSPPLSTIIDPLLRHSRNEYAETLIRALSPPGAPATEAAGLEVLRDTLTALGVDASLYRAFDGSGLSRYDMVTAEALVRTLTAVWHDPVLRGPFQAALPAFGVEGSGEKRLQGTPAQGRVWAKTGSMFNIRGLSGYILTEADEPLVFSFLANTYTVPSAQIEAMMDAALVRLVTGGREAGAPPTASPR